MYELRNDFLVIYILKNGDYKNVENYGKYEFSIVPIETCNGEWCKIYYPCSDTEYFVKKMILDYLKENNIDMIENNYLAQDKLKTFKRVFNYYLVDEK